MKKNRRNNSRPAAITTAKDTTKAIETRAGVLKEAEDVKKEAKTSFYLQYMGKEISTEEITQKVHEAWKTLGKNVDEIKTLNVYLKPEEAAAYYVINEETTGKVAISCNNYIERPVYGYSSIEQFYTAVSFLDRNGSRYTCLMPIVSSILLHLLQDVQSVPKAR